MGPITWQGVLKAAAAHWEVYHLIGWTNIARQMRQRECVAMVRAFEAAGFEVEVPDDELPCLDRGARPEEEDDLPPDYPPAPDVVGLGDVVGRSDSRGSFDGKKPRWARGLHS